MSNLSFLEWPFFNEEHRVLAKNLHSWAERSLHSIDERDVDTTCKELVQRLADGGWLKFCVPAAHGGIEEQIDVRSLALIRDILAYHSGLADFSFAMQGLGSGAITIAGSAELKRKYLPAVCQGKKIAAFALSEPDAGSDVAAISTTARAAGDQYILSGTKTWISNGGIADYYVLFARTGEGPGTKGLSAFVVDADSPGLVIKERIQVIAPHPLATLELKDLKIPQNALIGQPGDGFKIAMATLDIFRSTVGAAALGFARRALDEALQRASTRKIFDGVLADLQMTQAKIAEMALDIDAAALLIYRAAWRKDTSLERATADVAMAKLYGTEMSQNVIDKAVQILGGLGVVSGHPVEKLYREVRALRIYEGASEVQKMIIARQVLSEFAKKS